MGKGLQKVFKTVVKDISQYYHLWENLVQKFPISFQNLETLMKLKKLSDDIKKPWIKATKKQIKNIIKDHTFLVEDPNKGEPVTACMDVCKTKIQSYGSLDKLKLGTVVRGYLQNKELVRDNWSPTASMRTLR